MLFVGIDVAKSKHDFCIMDSNGVILTGSLRISNTKEGFDTLYTSIISALESTDFSNVKIGLESTGHYSTNITNYLYSKGFRITVQNPLVTKPKQISVTPKSLQLCSFLMIQNPIHLHHTKSKG